MDGCLQEARVAVTLYSSLIEQEAAKVRESFTRLAQVLECMRPAMGQRQVVVRVARPSALVALRVRAN